MRVVTGYPPNIEKIRARLAVPEGAVFAYGDVRLLLLPMNVFVRDESLVDTATSIRTRLLSRIARDLAGPMYGCLVTRNHARGLIQRAAAA